MLVRLRGDGRIADALGRRRDLERAACTGWAPREQHEGREIRSRSSLRPTCHFKSRISGLVLAVSPARPELRAGHEADLRALARPARHGLFAPTRSAFTQKYSATAAAQASTAAPWNWAQLPRRPALTPREREPDGRVVRDSPNSPRFPRDLRRIMVGDSFAADHRAGGSGSWAESAYARVSHSIRTSCGSRSRGLAPSFSPSVRTCSEARAVPGFGTRQPLNRRL